MMYETMKLMKKVFLKVHYRIMVLLVFG